VIWLEEDEKCEECWDEEVEDESYDEE